MRQGVPERVSASLRCPSQHRKGFKHLPLAPLGPPVGSAVWVPVEGGICVLTAGCPHRRLCTCYAGTHMCLHVGVQQGDSE